MKNTRISKNQGKNSALSRTLLLIFLFSFLTVNLSANASNEFKQRYSTNAEKTRVVFEFPEKVGFSWQTLSNSPEIILTIINPRDAEQLTVNNLELSASGIKNLEYRHNKESNNLEIVFHLKNNPNFTVFDLLPSINNGHRVIVDVFATAEPIHTAILHNQKSDIKKDTQQIQKKAESEPELILGKNSKVSDESQKIVIKPLASSPSGVELSVEPTSGFEVAKKKKFLIVIDPGHGGVDLGSVSPNKRFEKDLTLRIANHLHQQLNTLQNVSAALTRNEDVYIYPHKRSEIAENLHADVLISLHADTHESNESQQISVWSYQSAATSSTVGRDLIQAESEAVLLGNVADLLNNVSQVNTVNARNVALVDADKVLRSQKLASILSTNLNSKFKQVTPSVQQANFIVLAGENVPSLVVNFGYLLNKTIFTENEIPEQDKDLNNVKRKLFEAIVATINQYSLIPERDFYKHDYRLQAGQKGNVIKTIQGNKSAIKEPLANVELNTNDLLAHETFQGHTVAVGDSLYQISKMYNTSIAVVKDKNKLLTNSIQIGQVVLVPTPNSP